MDETVTVFRSADASAEEDAIAAAEMLRDAGISPALLDDECVGVPEGVWEVRVAARDRARAEQLLAARRAPQEEFTHPDPSPDLDFATVYSSGDAAEGEAEALTIQGLLEANGIDAAIAGEGVPFPNLGWQVRVAKDRADEARRIIGEARAAGPSAAEEAEAETEG